VFLANYDNDDQNKNYMSEAHTVHGKEMSTWNRLQNWKETTWKNQKQIREY
jgi:hypothetical protein